MANIAVLDDEEEIRNILEIQLREYEYKVKSYANCKEFLENLPNFHPDLVLLDIMMDRTGGYEVLSYLKQKYPDIIVIFLTARTNHLDRIKGLAYGADDYITKPFRKDDLVARINSFLRRNESYKKDACCLNYLKQELNLAKKVQESFLPKNFNDSNLEFVAKYLPFNEIGGDIYDFSVIHPGYYRIFLSDVAGNGIQAALIAIFIKTEYDKIKKSIESPDQLLQQLNSIFFERFQVFSILASAIIIDIDFQSQKIFYASAGHLNQYYYADDYLFPLCSTGKLLGILSKTSYKTNFQDLKKPSQLILFTNGLLKEIPETQEESGVEKLKKMIFKNRTDNINFLLNKILKEYNLFISKSNKNDDTTLLGVDIK